MWHEARKQERKIRGMIVDYRKRAERRQDFYEKIKADPAQFIQIHGRKCKIHLDSSIATAADGGAIIVPWQGNPETLIDRFDVRAHLDDISITSKYDEQLINLEERHCNYERYRILAQNEFLGVSEEKYLYQLRLEEQFGANFPIESEKHLPKKKMQSTRAAISYYYGDKSQAASPLDTTSFEAESDSDLDMDVTIAINQIDSCQAQELNSCGRNFGMTTNDLVSFLTKDSEEALAIKMAKEIQQEKIILSGRKSRRERRVQRDKRLSGKSLSPPSYAAKEDTHSITCGPEENDSDSNSSAPGDNITFITSFGGEDELRAHSKIMINVNNKLSKRTFTDAHSENTSNYSLNSVGTYARCKSSMRKDAFEMKYSSKHCTLGNSRLEAQLFTSDKCSDESKHIYERKSPNVFCPSTSFTTAKSSSLMSRGNSQGMSEKIGKKVLSHTFQEALNSSHDQESSVTNISSEIPIKRYYGRKRDCRHDSSADSVDSSSEQAYHTPNVGPDIALAEFPVLSHQYSVPTSTRIYSSCLQPKVNSNQRLRDRLKKKMQSLLNRQYKADKKAEMERTERQIQQKQVREDEMRELALRLRKRQRELRHQYGSPGNSSSSSYSPYDSDGQNSILLRKRRVPNPKTNSSAREKYEMNFNNLSNHSRNRSRSPQKCLNNNTNRKQTNSERNVKRES